MPLSKTRLKAVDGIETAVTFLNELGYGATARPIDLGEIAIAGASKAIYLKNEKSLRKGFGVVVAELAERPRSLRRLAPALLRVHDQPLAVFGTGTGAHWDRMTVVRPRRAGTKGAITLTKLEIDLTRPTQHDASVLENCTWKQRGDVENQRAVDNALDVERVTNAFFKGLKRHYDILNRAVSEALADNAAASHHLSEITDEPSERVTLRILTQVLFCEFLQRKGLIENQPDWLRWAWAQKQGPYYSTVLEPLFYDALGTPVPVRRDGVPDVPYLNGGLFERLYGPASLELPDEVFDADEGLLGFLGSWTFTIAEEMPQEAEVAVDPEMLGKVFEQLSDEVNRRAKGAVYTPRPVVHFMVREALVPWLEGALEIEEPLARTLLTSTDPFDELRSSMGQSFALDLAVRLPDKVDDLRVIDPAVGSGAFPLGMLAELIRLRSLAFRFTEGVEPADATVHMWKLQLISHSLFGVDIEPHAIELCRLRLWLALVVDLPNGVPPEPLPNLDYRTIVANSLTDFAHGIEAQNTRGGLEYHSLGTLTKLHESWFTAQNPEMKSQLRSQLDAAEKTAVELQLSAARGRAATPKQTEQIDELARQFTSATRAYPVFVPALHAPDVAARGGWDIVIMNPPYVGRKEVRQRLPAWHVADLESHYGETNDLMILFAIRARQLLRDGGVMSMIFNDSIFTSVDANELRRELVSSTEIRAVARAKCFEGKAVNGGVIVTIDRAPDPNRSLRWIEAYKKPVSDLAAASRPLEAKPSLQEAGELEVWQCERSGYARLPHRPLFRPSPEAVRLLKHWDDCRNWKGGWERWDVGGAQIAWPALSNTSLLTKHRDELDRSGFYETLEPGQWLLLGTVIDGGQGLATADDKRFLAAADGTAAADEHRKRQTELEALVLASPDAAVVYEAHRNLGRELALLAVWDPAIWDDFSTSTRPKWPRTGAFRIASPDDIRTMPLSDEERANGIAAGPHFVPYEKGDDSDATEDGHAVGAAWCRDNPIVIDWSRDAVELLRTRQRGNAARKPYPRNEHLWFREGATWNRVASYLRARVVPEFAIFSSESPTVSPIPQVADWLTPRALLALLNSDVLDFLLRTFLGSRMHLEIGDVRRLPIPVLSASDSMRLSSLAEEAVEAKRGSKFQRLAAIERDNNIAVRDLYGIDPDEELWVVR